MLGDVPVEKLSAPVLVGLIVLMILLRWLVPRATYKEKCQEAENWRQAYEAERDARAKSDAQTTELLELAKTTHNVLVSWFGTSTGLERTGGERWDSSKNFAGQAPQRRTRRKQGKLSQMLEQISSM
jgi:hypothetical protein